MDVDDINDVVLWSQGSRCFKKVEVVDDMNDSRSRWAQAYRCYEQFKALDEMNNPWF